jgi:hypothetical protein
VSAPHAVSRRILPRINGPGFAYRPAAVPLQAPAQFKGTSLAAIVAGLAVVTAVLACRSAEVAIAAPAARGDGRQITVRGALWAQGVTVSPHDVLIVPPPARYDEWRVQIGSDAIVRLLTAADRVRRPGADGWRLEAVARGETTVAFVPFVPFGKESSTPNEPRFTLRVMVR